MSVLIFDYDGTLHDCSVIYCPAFRRAYETLVQRGLAEKHLWTDGEITKWLGYSAKAMWDSFAPDLPQEEKNRCSALIGSEMLRLLESGQAKLYDGVFDLLETLKQEGNTLIFLSNCKISYMNAHRSRFGLDRWFSGYYCTEQYGWKAKTEVFPQIKRDFAGDYVVIGDRFHDLEVAQRFGLPSVGCAYGYGEEQELSNASVIAETPSDIPSLLHKLNR